MKAALQAKMGVRSAESTKDETIAKIAASLAEASMLLASLSSKPANTLSVVENETIIGRPSRNNPSVSVYRDRASFSPLAVRMYHALVAAAEAQDTGDASKNEWKAELSKAPNYGGRAHPMNPHTFDLYLTGQSGYTGSLWERVSHGIYKPIPGALDNLRKRR